jgi:hypothetical protein
MLGSILWCLDVAAPKIPSTRSRADLDCTRFTTASTFEKSRSSSKGWMAVSVASAVYASLGLPKFFTTRVQNGLAFLFDLHSARTSLASQRLSLLQGSISYDTARKRDNNVLQQLSYSSQRFNFFLYSTCLRGRTRSKKLLPSSSIKEPPTMSFRRLLRKDAWDFQRLHPSLPLPLTPAPEAS